MGPESKLKRNINPLVAGGIVAGIVVVIVVVVVVLGIVLRKNAYGSETRIDNISTYYGNLRQNEKDLIFHELYNMLERNMGEQELIPENGAMVRDETAQYDYDELTRVYYGNFIVDVPAAEWSFRVKFEWSPEQNSQNLSGYPVMVLCLGENLWIYEYKKGCDDIQSKVINWVNEYQIDYSFGAQTSYKIRKLLEDYWLENLDADSYVAEVDETSLKKLKNEPGVTYRFVVDLNGNQYQITARTDEMYGEEYIAALMEGGGEKVGFILMDSDNVAISDWLIKIAGVNELKVIEGSLKGAN